MRSTFSWAAVGLLCILAVAFAPAATVGSDQATFKFANWKDLPASARATWLEWYLTDGLWYLVFAVGVQQAGPDASNGRIDLVLFHMRILDEEGKAIGAMTVGMEPVYLASILTGELYFGMEGYLQAQDWSFTYLCGAGAPQC